MYDTYPPDTLLPCTVRRLVLQHTSYSNTASHTFTQNRCCFYDKAISCGLTGAITKKSCLDRQQKEGDISAGCFKKTTFLQGNPASINLALTAGDKNTKVSFTEPSEEPNVFVLRRRFSSCCTKGFSRFIQGKRHPFQVF
jgi:hypothetical protein